MLHIFTVEMGLLYFRVNVFTQKDNWTTLCNLKSKSLQGFFFFSMQHPCTRKRFFSSSSSSCELKGNLTFEHMVEQGTVSRIVSQTFPYF